MHLATQIVFCVKISFIVIIYVHGLLALILVLELLLVLEVSLHSANQPYLLRVDTGDWFKSVQFLLRF